MLVAQKKRVVLSVSQIESWNDCKRLDYLKRVEKVPEIEKNFQTFGTVLHAVAARWLRANDVGRDESGKAVELYPAGWHVAEPPSWEKEKGAVGGEITPHEQTLVKKLIEKAIGDGILVRKPGRKIELEFRRPLFEDDEHEVTIMGFIDLLEPDNVVDHKTAKTMRYALSPSKLEESIQMRTYACELRFLRAERGEAPLPQYGVQHNVFSKDPDNPVIRRTTSRILNADLDKHWQFLQDTAREMLRSRAIEHWHDVPAASEASGACQKYGGCAMLDICTGKRNPQEQTARVLHVKSQRVDSVQSAAQQATALVASTAPSFYQGDPMVSQFESRLAARSAAQVGAAPPAQPITQPVAINPPLPIRAVAPPSMPQAMAATPTPLEPVIKVAPTGSAPWAYPDCKSCSGSGINAKGAPCMMCNRKRAVAVEPTEADYFWEILADGSFCYELKPGVQESIDATAKPGAVVVANVAPKPAARTQERAAAPAVAAPVIVAPAATVALPTPVYQVAPPAVAAVEQADEGDEPEVGNGKEKGKRGPKPRGFTLLINCTPTRAAGSVVHLDTVMHKFGTGLAQSQGLESFYQLDAFKRRDAMCGTILPAIIEELGKSIVVCRRGDPDTNSMIAALSAHAWQIIEPCG